MFWVIVASGAACALVVLSWTFNRASGRHDFGAMSADWLARNGQAYRAPISDVFSNFG